MSHNQSVQYLIDKYLSFPEPLVSVPFQVGGEQISFLFKESTVRKVAEQNAFSVSAKKPQISQLPLQSKINSMPVIQEERPILKVKRVKFNTD
jgi:hypothetical protein